MINLKQALLIRNRGLTVCISCLLALALVCGIPTSAFADVRKADIILEQTVDSRGLAVSQCPDIAAEYAYIIDDQGTVYFDRGGEETAQIASVTKIMTALVALESASLDTTIQVSSHAASVGESSAELHTGDTLDLETALVGLMVSSGNDAAVAIAESLGKSLIAEGRDISNISDEEGLRAFVNRMNELAAEIGMSNSEFSNPHGLDYGDYSSNQHSCARDVAIMSKKAMENETLRNITSMAKATITVQNSEEGKRTIELENTNELLGSYEGVGGIKTGYTDLAGNCLASVIERDGRELYVVILDSPDPNQRFDDTTNGADWVYKHRIAYELINTTDFASDLSSPIVAEVAHSDWVDQTVKGTVADPTVSVEIFDLNGNISQTVEYEELSGKVNVGDKLGTIQFKQRNATIMSVDIIAAEEVSGPNFFQGIGIWWDRLFKGFTGDAKVAESVLLNETPLINDKTDASND